MDGVSLSNSLTDKLVAEDAAQIVKAQRPCFVPIQQRAGFRAVGAEIAPLMPWAFIFWRDFVMGFRDMFLSTFL